MRIAVSIVHPAHFHMYKTVIKMLEEEGHEVDILAFDKDIVLSLLDSQNIPYTVIGKKSDRPTLDLIRVTFELINWFREFKPDVVLDRGITGPVCRMFRVPNVVYSDDGTISARIITAFSTLIVSPSSLEKKYFFSNEVKKDAMKEMMYLHGDSFRPNVNRINGPRKPYILIRWVSLKAYHDRGVSGLSDTHISKIVNEFSNDYDVFISSEGELPQHLEPFRAPFDVESIHDAIYFATLVITDSQTFTKESAILGTPVIRHNSFVGKRDNPVFGELESRYGIVRNIRSCEEVIPTAQNFLKSGRDWKDVSERIHNEYENLTEFIFNQVLAVGARSFDRGRGTGN